MAKGFLKKMPLLQVWHFEVGMGLIRGFIGPSSLELVLLKRSGEVRHRVTLCATGAALLKIALALGRRWAVVHGHAMDADLKGNVCDGEPFTPVILLGRFAQ